MNKGSQEAACDHLKKEVPGSRGAFQFPAREGKVCAHIADLCARQEGRGIAGRSWVAILVGP
jgi:hypothetical protein